MYHYVPTQLELSIVTGPGGSRSNNGLGGGGGRETVYSVGMLCHLLYVASGVQPTYDNPPSPLSETLTKITVTCSLPPNFLFFLKMLEKLLKSSQY